MSKPTWTEVVKYYNSNLTRYRILNAYNDGNEKVQHECAFMGNRDPDRCHKASGNRFYEFSLSNYIVPQHCGFFKSLLLMNMPNIPPNKEGRKKMQREILNNFGDYWFGTNYCIDIDVKEEKGGLPKAIEYTKSCMDVLNARGVPTEWFFSVAGHSPVLVKLGKEVVLMPISEAIEKLKNGEEMKILSLDKNNKVTFSKIYDYLKHEDDLYEVKHEQSTIPLEVTKHHSVYVLNDECDVVEKEVDNLEVGDYLVTFNKKNEKLKKEKKVTFDYEIMKNGKNTKGEKIKVTDSVILDKNVLRLIGYYLGDGHITMNERWRSCKIGFSFNVKETEFIDDVKKILDVLEHSSFYQRKAKKVIKLRKGGYTVKQIIKKLNISKSFVERVLYDKLYSVSGKKISYCENKPNGGSLQIVFSSLKWYHFFNKFCGKGAKNKHLPNFVWDLSREEVLELLRGYINSDGWKKGKYTYDIKSVSKKMITDWVWLLKLNGISCNFSWEQSKPHKLPQGTMFKGSLSYKISIPKAEIGDRKHNKLTQ